MIAKDSFVPVPVDMTDTLISFKEPKRSLTTLEVETRG